MKRSALLVIAVSIITALISVASIGQIEGLPGYIASDIQLISQESKADWSARWTGPIEAATILAWFHGYGYPRFLTDLNGDGVIDELDTIELADDLGHGPMKTNTFGTNDVRLVVALAHYVAAHYPDQFTIKIYDASFPAEFNAAGFGQLAPDVIDGIVLEVKEDPSIAAYEYELESAEGVIVGLEENEGENNTYLTGRSFLYERTPDGYTPVDLAWAEEDRWTPGYQGQVLETAAMMDDEGMYIDYGGAWTPVEFMLALSPIEQRRGGPHTVEGCPPDAIAYDVTVSKLFDSTTDKQIGSVRVEECVTREGDIDTYTYTLTNIDYTNAGGCGLCFFLIHVPPTLPTVSHSEPLPWLFSGFPGLWAWRTPLGDCGVLPGESVTFSASVPGPTVDAYVPGGVGPCVPLPDGEGLVLVPILAIRTTGPSEEGEDGGPDEGPDEGPGCPDLTVIRIESVCSLDRERTVTVAATIKNIGDQPTTTATWAHLSSSTHPGSDWASVPPLDPGEEIVVHLSFSFSFNYPPCVDLTVDVDPFDNIDECNESNNEMDGSICCPK